MNYVKPIIFIFINVFIIGVVKAEEQGIPYKTESYPTENILTRIIVVMLLVALIAYGVIVLIKRYYHGGLLKKVGGGDIRLIELKRISPQLTVYKIQIDAKEVSLVQSNNNLLVIHEKEINKTNDATEPEKTD